MKYRVEYREAGDALSDAVTFFHRAWDECIELQVVDKEAWVAASTESITERNRFELVAYSGEHPIGGLILIRDWDGHVGDCMSVMFNYVLPEHRAGAVGIRLYGSAIALTRKLGVGVLAYSHRVRDWEYAIKYRKVQ